MKDIPTIEQAEAYLQEADKLNPGPWISHSRYVGKAAKLIAEKHPKLNPEIALILGNLHDIGRRFGVSGIRHAYDGYEFLTEQSFPDAARICLTHSFPTNLVNEVAERWDGPLEQLEFTQAYLNEIELDDYDRLLQLCDALAMPHGFVLLEKRLLDAAIRRGVNEFTLKRWQVTFEIQAEFEENIGTSIYSLLDGVVENTFGFHS